MQVSHRSATPLRFEDLAETNGNGNGNVNGNGASGATPEVMRAIASELNAVVGLNEALASVEARVKAGFASGLDLEESRRAALVGDAALSAWRQERASAWIALYRAVGGGWDGDPVQSR